MVFALIGSLGFLLAMTVGWSWIENRLEDHEVAEPVASTARLGSAPRSRAVLVGRMDNRGARQARMVVCPRSEPVARQ
jgi:hypothetical protein